MKLQLWLLSETPKARLFKRTAPGSQAAHDQIWIPRSVCPHVHLDAPTLGGGPRRCEVEVEAWFVTKNNLGTSVID